MNGFILRSIDFDPQIQKVFNTLYSDITPTDWRKWLKVSSKEEYENLAMKLSGISEPSLIDKLRRQKTDSRKLSVDFSSLLEGWNSSNPIVVCHTSGTSGGSLSELKWLYISKNLVRRLWAPGMQAIFESSGLNHKSSIAIFIPSRIKGDGLSFLEETKLIKLYSSEFSQRLTLSLIKPSSYLMDTYRNAKSIETISKMLSMERISVVSAPASTILGWADLRRLLRGLKKSLANLPEKESTILSEILLGNHDLNLNVAAEIQERLSEVMSEATLVFSISSITEEEWGKIRDFMKWKHGDERFTNLYVGSEIGPFAANIRSDARKSLLKDEMYIFPLTLPTIESKGEIELISRSKQLKGNLLVSRMGDSNPLINIDTGDVIEISSQEGLPRISGSILRAVIRYKLRLKISPSIKITREHDVYVGDYFDLGDIEIFNARSLFSCLAAFNFIKNSSMLISGPNEEDRPWTLYITKSGDATEADICRGISECPGGKAIKTAIQNEVLRIKLLEQNLFVTKIPRSQLVRLVRSGELPKGVLKRWPLYLILYRNDKTRHIGQSKNFARWIPRG